MDGPHETRSGLHVGLRFRYGRTYTEADLRGAVRMTEDRNGYHLDDAFSRAAGFRGVITPGLLQASLFTKIGGDLNLLAREMTFAFRRPVYAGDTIEAEIVITALDPETRQAAFEGEATNQHGEVVLTCRCAGLLPDPAWGTPDKSRDPGPGGC